MSSDFGKYDVPPTLNKLIALQKELDDAEQFYRGFDFYVSLGGIRYFNTPCDVIPFGNIGVDGIHYGFLTDYGSVTDLEEASIVCVSPMKFSRPTRIVANNLSAFLRVNMTDGELFYNTFTSEQQYTSKREQWIAKAAQSPYQSSEEEKQTRERLHKWLLDHVPLPTFTNPYQYVQNVRLEWERKVTVQTQDGLGVTTPLLNGEQHIPFVISKSAQPDLNLLQIYMNEAPMASRLAVIRDIQLNYVLQDEPNLHAIVVRTLNKLNLTDEAERI